MCGITIVWDRDRQRAATACRRATDMQQHRGPDAEGFLTIPLSCGSLALGHRRLAILDLSAAGAQPMVDSKTENAIVYNGEIYNFRVLRKELESKGAVFSSNSDTEVLLLGYREWGTEVFDRARGMFAVVIWDAHRRSLILARDHAGMKPLYLHLDPNQLVVASELQAIVNSGIVEKNINKSSLAGLLAYGSVPEPLTMIEDVAMFPPATWARIDLSDSPRLVEQAQYWSFPAEVEQNQKTDFRDMLDASVRGHLESDVPVGVFLSGGIDSTAIAAAAMRQGTGKLQTLTVGFAGHTSIDETAIAQETASQLGTEHQVVTVRGADALDQASSWMQSIDQPSLDGFNTYLVSHAASECGLKVVLSGLGGDELFGGYSSFRSLPRLHYWSRLARVIPPSIRRWIAYYGLFNATPTTRYKIADMASQLGSLVSLALGRRRLFSDRELHHFDLESTSLGLTQLYLPTNRKAPDLSEGSDLSAAVAATESNYYMRDTLLRDSDINGMSHSLEIRLPLLDRDLMTAALQMPTQQRMSRDGINKPRLVEAGGPHVRSLAKNTKRGFSLPYDTWIRGPLDELVQESIEVVADSGLLAPQGLQKTLATYRCSRHGASPWSRIWTLTVLGQWLRRLKSTPSYADSSEAKLSVSANPAP